VSDADLPQPLHSTYHFTMYVLFYPTGSRGYHRALRLTESTAAGVDRRRMAISPRMFYRFHLHPRVDSFQFLLRGGLLTLRFDG
jgi:hypothetical protein